MVTEKRRYNLNNCNKCGNAGDFDVSEDFRECGRENNMDLCISTMCIKNMKSGILGRTVHVKFLVTALLNDSLSAGEQMELFCSCTSKALDSAERN